MARSSLILDWPRSILAGKHNVGKNPLLDKTGIVVDQPDSLEIWWDDSDILYVNYQSFGHSFWRAQEFSLFRKYRHLVKRPLLDFGCGDGSFASILFDKIDYGVDIDPEALDIARKFGVYETVLNSASSTIPTGDNSIGSIISNSVLEHLTNLDDMLKELYRVLQKDGMLLFTVPVRQYERDLNKYFGAQASNRVNVESSHHNLLEIDEWKVKLENCGFKIIQIHQFQPHWFTFWFRMFRLLGNHGLAMIIPDIRQRIWKRYHPRLISMVKSSIDDTTVGGNIFVVAKK